MKAIKPLNDSLIRKYEKKLTKYLVRFVPKFLGTKYLTYICLISSVLVYFSYSYSKSNINFLYLASFFIIIQWIFDMLDGSVGRHRNEGFIRWGYFMDHLFDFFFMVAVIYGLFVYIEDQNIILTLIIFSGYMVTFFLYNNVNDKEDFQISLWHMSPSEFRIAIILLNVILHQGIDITPFITYFNYLSILVLITIIHIYQRKLSKLDVARRNN